MVITSRRKSAYIRKCVLPFALKSLSSRWIDREIKLNLWARAACSLVAIRVRKEVSESNCPHPNKLLLDNRNQVKIHSCTQTTKQMCSGNAHIAKEEAERCPKLEQLSPKENDRWSKLQRWHVNTMSKKLFLLPWETNWGEITNVLLANSIVNNNFTLHFYGIPGLYSSINIHRGSLKKRGDCTHSWCVDGEWQRPRAQQGPTWNKVENKSWSFMRQLSWSHRLQFGH